jgi:hypothetical protein
VSEFQQERSAGARPPGGLAFVAWTLLFLFWTLCAVASFLPNARLWGINHLAFYPWPVRAVALVVMAVSLLPTARRAVLRSLEGLSGLLAGRRRLVASALAIVAFILFNAFASSTQLLGDGIYVENNVERAAKVDSETIAKVLKTPDPIYPGTEMLYLALTRVISNAVGVPPLDVLRVLIALLGALLVFIVAASRPPGGASSKNGLVPATDATPWVVLAFLSGAVQIFFGYVEAYAPLMFFAALFLLFARGAIDGRAGLWAPVLFALVALGMHRMGLVLFPALGVLVLWVACGRQKTARFAWGAVVLAVGTIALPPLVVIAGDLGQYVLPMTTRSHAYAVLSAAHFVDVANEILLVFPGFFVLGTTAVLLERWKRSGFGERGEDAGSGGSPDETTVGTKSPGVLFGLFLGVPVLMFLLFFKPELGMGRDWDLFAMTSLAFWAPVSAVLERARTGVETRAIVEIVLGPVLVMTAVLAIAWIGVNAHAGRSVARFESILKYDRTRAGYAYETLASYHHQKQDYPAEINALENAVAASRNPRYLLTLGIRYYDAGEKEEAVSTIRSSLQINPEYTDARKTLVQMLLVMGREDDMVEVGEEGARLAPGDPYYPFYLGMAYARQDRLDDARRAFQRCLELKPAPEIVREIDGILRALPPASTDDASSADGREGKP